MIIKFLIIALSLWAFLAIIFPTLFLPNQLLFKTKIQHTNKIKKIANKLKSNNKEKTLENIYSYVIRTYKGREEKYKLINYPKLFLYDVDKLIGKEQFLACHIQNHIIKTLLMNTNQFKDKDIQKKQIITAFLTTHQYLVITINNQKYEIDPFFKIFKKL